MDGSQHADNVEHDAHRSEILVKSGFRVVRFWNNDVLVRIDEVLAEILRNLQAPPSPQPLSRQRERG
jgi:very-short-patch-repair endonuclease